VAAEQNVAKGLRDWLNWYIPIVLIFLAFRFTKSYPQQVRAEQQAQGAGRA
jgi:preprotein translocase subunit YajC